MKIVLNITGFFFLMSLQIKAQYISQNITKKEKRQAKKWVNTTYRSLSMNEKLGQLFIVALYTNKGKEHIEKVRHLVESEQLGGLILMQDDAQKHQILVNEFQNKSKVPMLIGIDAEWGLFQRFSNTYKFPWAITLGAVQDKSLLYEMGTMIARDAKKLGINWNFAPVVDINTNPKNPIIGNRSFGSDVENVVQSALAYSKGLQDHKVLATIKHFPGHGDTSVDSHHDLPIVEHDSERLQSIEIAPFQNLANQGIGGVMVAHLFVPTLEKQHNTPASVSKSIVTDLLKKQIGYKGIIVTDALNMGAVSQHYKAGILDALAFEAGNDLMLFSENVTMGKQQILQRLKSGKISKKRIEESVKKILTTKYFLGLNQYQPSQYFDINELNTNAHSELVQKIYENAITLVKNDKHYIPISKSEAVYYLPLEEAHYTTFANELKKYGNITVISKQEIENLPLHSKIIVGIHKDNSTAYKPYQISEESKIILNNTSKNHQVILNVFGSPYALQDIDISSISSVIISYENNDDAMKAAAKALFGKSKISGKLPVSINEHLKYGIGISINKVN